MFGLKGVGGWIAQGESHQIVSFEIEPLGEVSEHSHDFPQWGVVVEAKMEPTIDGKRVSRTQKNRHHTALRSA